MTQIKRDKFGYVLIKRKERPMSKLRGKVKWFDVKKGFGFITDDTGKEIFVHHSDIKGDGRKTLDEKESVEFETMMTPKGVKAIKVEVF